MNELTKTFIIIHSIRTCDNTGSGSNLGEVLCSVEFKVGDRKLPYRRPLCKFAELGWPDFDFFIPGHRFSKARRAAAWGPKGWKWE